MFSSQLALLSCCSSALITGQGSGVLFLLQVVVMMMSDRWDVQLLWSFCKLTDCLHSQVRCLWGFLRAVDVFKRSSDLFTNTGNLDCSLQ